MTTLVCYYCEKPGDLRPYGPGRTWICFPCAMMPERKAAVVEEYGRQLRAAGPVAVLTPEGPKPFKP